MCNLLIVNPTKDPFNTGVNINEPFDLDIQIAAYVQIGTGTLVTFTSSTISANGNYSVGPESGSFTLLINANSNGTYQVTINITGGAAEYSRNYTANCTASSGSVTLQDVASADNLVISQDNGSFLTDGRIQFNASWAPVSVYADSNT